MTKRKFRPKWSRDANLLARVVTGVLPTPEGLLERQRLTELSAIECFAKGVATQHDFQTVADMLNIAETFVSVGVGPEVLPVIQATQDALIAAKERHEKGASLSLTAAGLQSLRDLYEYTTCNGLRSTGSSTPRPSKKPTTASDPHIRT